MAKCVDCGKDLSEQGHGGNCKHCKVPYCRLCWNKRRWCRVCQKQL